MTIDTRLAEPSGHRIVLARRPRGLPVEADFRLEPMALPDVPAGGVLVENMWLSLDPYMRGRMDDTASYLPSVGIGETMVGRTIGRVIGSEHPNYRVGALVVAQGGWQTHAISDGSTLLVVPPDLERVTHALGALGNPGFAAYVGLREVSRPAPGQTVVISAAAGPVGATAVQIARLDGARVVAIAGGAAKTAFVRDTLGADVALDHRAADFGAQLRAATPGGVDLYFDNVGGEVLLAVLERMKDRARVALCGLAAWYNLDGSEGGPDRAPALMRTILRKRLVVEGFVLVDWAHRATGFRTEMRRWIAAGCIEMREDVTHGLQQAPGAFIRLLSGRTFGKALVRLGDGPGAADCG